MVKALRFLAVVSLMALILAACSGAQPAEEAEDAGDTALEPTGDTALEPTGDTALEPTPEEAATTEAADEGPQELTNVTLIRGLPTISATDAYLYAGMELGFFAEEGIELDVQHLQAGGTAVPTLLATGDGNVAMFSGQPLAIAADTGLAEEAGLIAICQNYYESIYQQAAVRADSDIETYDDLRGRSIGVFDVGVAGGGPPRGILKAQGFDPEEDVELLAVGLGPGAAEALMSEEVDALMLWDTQYATLEALGYDIRLLPKVDLPDVASVVATRKDYLESNRELLEGLLRAIGKSTLFALENPERTVELYHQAVPEVIGQDVSPEEAFERDLREFTTRLPKLDYREDPGQVCLTQEEDWRGMAEWLEVDVEDLSPYFTNELVEEANNFDEEAVLEQAEE